MIIVSYDIKDDKVRNAFAKLLQKQGAIRLQFSVYEVHNTKRIIENLKITIKNFSKHFTPADSVILFDILNHSSTKSILSNAIHRDKDIVFF